MRITRLSTLFCILFLVFAFTASAQRNRKPAPRATPKPTPISPDVTNAKQQVSNQLHNVNVFIDKMGPIAVIIENSDKEAAAGKLRKEAIDANNANKQKTIAAIRGLRDGLVTLETDFRTKPSLAQYLSKIQGISTLCAQSEDRAIAGQFVASKDPLRQVALKLNDTLAVMPGALIGGAVPAPQNRNASASGSSRTVPASTQPLSSGKREPVIGMTADEVLQGTWGAPSAKRTSTTSNGSTEVWMYPGNRSLYFFNGKVTNIVK